jgi:hypothetical protein
MKIRLIVAILGMAFSLAFPAFAQQEETVDSQLKVEIKDFKTSHFLEPKTALRNSPDAGPMEHVELPKSEPASNDLQF